MIIIWSCSPQQKASRSLSEVTSPQLSLIVWQTTHASSTTREANKLLFFKVTWRKSLSSLMPAVGSSHPDSTPNFAPLSPAHKWLWHCLDSKTDNATRQLRKTDNATLENKKKCKKRFFFVFWWMNLLQHKKTKKPKLLKIFTGLIRRLLVFFFPLCKCSLPLAIMLFSL